MQDPPVTARYAARDAARSPQAQSYRTQLESRQAALRSALAARNFHVAGSVSVLANAVFVVSTSDRMAEMRSLSGVADVIPMRKMHLLLNKATQLLNGPAAWTALGGVSNAGAGIKIGIIDSGIDQTHPAFQDKSLTPPSGFPKCTNNHPEDCSYTNNKVIVARSYIRQQAAGTNPSNVAANSIPDDYSPRDRQGHGTGTASAAAGNVNTGAVTFNGMAPKAFLGNYKVLGSPELFGGTLVAFEDAVIQAIEDAFTDGMDIVSCSLGTIALTDPSQDLVASAFDKAAVGGMVVVVAAGNDGGNGQIFPTPTYNVMSSPATAPHVIAVGATLNSHVFQPSVSVQGGAANLQSIAALTSDGYDYGPFYPVYAPLVDITQLGGDAFACNSLPANSLYGDFALVEVNPTGTRGGCNLNTASTNVANAGAVGIVFYLSNGSATYSPIIEDSSGNLPIAGPVVMVANSDGVNLKTYVDAHTGANVVIDPNGTEQTLTAYSTSNGYTPPLAANQLASYSSSGPAPGGMGLKPDIVATGGFDGNIASYANSGMYLATQSYDPAGELYSPSGYTAADGTSFAAPLVAGAAALVKQAHPGFTAAQIRSALINTASQDTNVDDQGYARTQTSFGAGRLDAGAAVSALVTVNPSSISFGSLSGSLPAATPVTVTNGGSGSVTLTINVGAPVAAAGTPVTGISVKSDQATLTIPANGTATFNISLAGAVPTAGQYTGYVTVTGTGVSLSMPYLFVVPSGVAYDMFAIIYSQIYSLYDYACFEGLPNTDLGPDQRLQIKVVDSSGAPVPNAPVKFQISPRNQVSLSTATGSPACTPSSSGSTVTCNTDVNGVATTEVTTGTVVGATPYVDASVPGFDYQFGYCNAVIAQPTISGIADSAVGQTTVAPGSFISIYGANLVNPAALYDTTVGDSAGYVPFPIGLDGVSVSFDIPGAYDGTPADYNGAPGHLVFVAANLGQINLQVPWELQGASSVQVKVNVDSVANSNIITVPLAPYAPTLFQANGIVAAVDATTGTIITASNPAKAGDVVELYGNGLGPVNNQPASGDPSPSVEPLARTKTTPTVTIGGQNAAVAYSGLAPGSPGLYQINVTVPSGVASGNQTVTLNIGGAASPNAVIPIK